MTIEEMFQLEPLPPSETDPAAPPAPLLDDSELTRHLAAEQFADLDEAAKNDLVYADVRAAIRLREEGKLNQWHGQHVAFLRGQFVGASANLNQLFDEIQGRFHVTSDRLAVIFVDDFWV